jgi:hypothetical protein
MIDLQRETLISLTKAAQLLPPGPRGPKSPSCILRWILDGVQLPSGEHLRLEGVKLGAQWFTSVEALQRFGERQTPEPANGPAPQG